MTKNNSDPLTAAHERGRQIEERLEDMTQSFDEAVFECTALEGLEDHAVAYVLDPAKALNRAVNAAMDDHSKME